MARVTNTPVRLARKRRLMKAAKGFWGARHRQYKVMKESVHRAWAYAYIGRRLKKRDFRRLWILRVNAASRARGMIVQPIHPRAEEGGRGAQPQGALGDRDLATPRPSTSWSRSRSSALEAASRLRQPVRVAPPFGGLPPRGSPACRGSRPAPGCSRSRGNDAGRSDAPPCSTPSEPWRRRPSPRSTPRPIADAVKAAVSDLLGKKGRLQEILRPSVRCPRRSAARSAGWPTSRSRPSRPRPRRACDALRRAREADLGETEWVDATLPGRAAGRRLLPPHQPDVPGARGHLPRAWASNSPTAPGSRTSGTTSTR